MANKDAVMCCGVYKRVSERGGGGGGMIPVAVEERNDS